MADEHEEFIPTRGSLLSRLKSWDDQESWRQFFNTYWRLIYGVAIKAGLTEAEAQDVVQETVFAVAKTMPEFRYDPKACSFKTWLHHLTRKRIVDQYRKRAPVGTSRMGTDHGPERVAPDQVPDPASLNLEAVWEEDWHRNLMDAAIEKVKARVEPKTYQMFYLYTLKEMSVQEVARSMRVSAAQVYLAKHRVAALIKKEVRKLEAQMR